MNGAEKIKEKILKEAKDEADKLIKQAKTEAEKINERNKKTEGDYSDKRKNEIKKAVNLFKDKTLAQSRLKVRREYLAERETIIDNLLKGSLSSINPSSKDYEAYLKKIIDNNLKFLSDDIKIYCSNQDKSLVKKLIGKKASIEVTKIDGGLLLEDSNGKRVDETLAVKIERVKDRIRQVIVKKIKE